MDSRLRFIPIPIPILLKYQYQYRCCYWYQYKTDTDTWKKLELDLCKQVLGGLCWRWVVWWIEKKTKCLKNPTSKKNLVQEIFWSTNNRVQKNWIQEIWIKFIRTNVPVTIVSWLKMIVKAYLLSLVRINSIIANIMLAWSLFLWVGCS